MYAVIGAHPDDAEIGAGGLLASKGGLIVSLTCGHNHTRDSDTAGYEQEVASAVLGCQFEMLSEMELYSPNKRLVTKLDNIFLKWKIDAVVTHTPNDSNQEHVACARAVIAAARHIHKVLFFEPMPPSGRCEFTPQMYLDISSVAERKYQSIDCYVSQLHRRGRNLRETRQCLDSWRSCEADMGGYAEAFEVLRWKL